MTNYQVLCFLQEDGGYYDVHGHIKLLQSKFPDMGFTDERIKNLRNIMTRSESIRVDRHWRKSSMGLKVVFVSPKFANYSKSAAGFGKETTKPRWTYLKGEHPETINAILRRQMFDRLLSECRDAQR
ncbi:hypothetical protein [Serratia plymuthica]|uniref:hypothetical protein n=1 Tax=Serratia plymuthica TaxID=82996 RepID=UPI0007E9568F|nr:hypothetical protein [Serratia plymuthica]ANJ92467.1 hypothetical protein ADP72_05525 [Serratia plymuthica]